MSTIDWCVIATALAGLAIWVHGCFRTSLGSCLLGLLLPVVGSVGYFIAFSQTRTMYLAAILFVPFLLSLPPFRRTLLKPWGKGLVACVVLLGASAVFTEFKFLRAGNALLVIEPYRTGPSGWAFDAPALRLRSEPFVLGIPEMINRIVADIPGADRRVRLIFSQRPFPGGKFRLDRRHEENGGFWYFSEEYQMEGWLCPALFKFFPRAPQHIYVKAEAT
jgi:hypothetical protein